MSTITTLVKCDECGHKGAKRRVKLNPRNLHATYRLLCAPCGTKLGFRLEEERGQARAGSSIQRGWA